MKTNEAINVENVGGIWQSWQRANNEEAKRIRDQFTNEAIRKGFWAANRRLTETIHAKTGLPLHLISEYQRRHQYD